MSMLIKTQMAEHAINLSEYVLQKVLKLWESFISYTPENNTRSTKLHGVCFEPNNRV